MSYLLNQWNCKNWGSLFLPCLILLCAFTTQAAEPNSQAVEFFEKRVRPLLVQHCYDCHGEETQEANLRLDSYHGIMTGGDSGPAVVTGKPQRSLLVSVLQHNADALQMPPEEKLSAEAIAAVTRWVADGAQHLEMDKPVPLARPTADLQEARKFWSFQRPVKAEPPEVSNPPWCQTEMDRFVLAMLDEHQLIPVEPADKRTLLRRATYGLTGLPPTPEEIEAFLVDETADAWQRVIERLLASPRYGEHWGRHWLDVVRYADSNGLDENVAHGNAWRYRDYVIHSLNADKPFDQFLTEQLAGDLLPADTEEQRQQNLIATGFLSLGPKVLAEGDETKMQMDIIDEQIDTIGKAFLGLTLGCARCHDHKFDPISTADYYALAGIFKSTKTMESFKRIAKWNENTIASAAERAAKATHDAKIDNVTERIQQLEAELRRSEGEQVATEVANENINTTGDTDLLNEIKTLKGELAELKEHALRLPTAMGVQEAPAVDVPIHVRGSHLTLGVEVPRNLPALFCQDQPLLIAPTSSGRLELAHWLVSQHNPLTARVTVNRVWRWHFGTGLVESTENFGHLGKRPVNQELLDWLAVEFVESGWSLKHLHRLILSSSTYQLSSHHHAGNANIDPVNQFRWRFQPQRLEAGSIRDAMLAVSGQLDLSMGGSLLHVQNREFIFNHTSKDETNYSSRQRSVYLPVIRNHLYDGFALFDYTDASVPNGNRNTSTIAPQALYLLNSELSAECANALAQRTLRQVSTHSDRLQFLYQLSYGRVPTSQDVELATQLLDALHGSDEERWSVLAQAILASSEFIYVR